MPRIYTRIPPEVRFWEKVRKTDNCWLWMAAKNKRGYGVLRLEGKNVPAPRFSWRLHHGPIPNGMLVCHRCDNPPCVRPDHLFLGTQLDNMADARAKGRTVATALLYPGHLPSGENHWNAKYTDAQIAEVRDMAAAGTPNTVIAGKFGMSRGYVSMIVKRQKRSVAA